MAKNDSKKSASKGKKHDLHDLGEDLKKLAEKAKAKYDAADDMTKKKIIGGIAGAVALVAGAIGAKKIHDKMKK